MPIVRHEDQIKMDQTEFEIHRRRDDFQVNNKCREMKKYFANNCCCIIFLKIMILFNSKTYFVLLT